MTAGDILWQDQEALLKRQRVKPAIVQYSEAEPRRVVYNYLLRVSNNLALTTSVRHASGKMMQVIGRLCDTILTGDRENVCKATGPTNLIDLAGSYLTTPGWTAGISP